jgi:hypothetical protein
VAFEPIDALQRTGHSKIRFARDGLKFFVIILKIVTLFSPLRVFLPISLVAFMVGAAYAVWTIATQSHVTNSSVLLIMWPSSYSRRPRLQPIAAMLEAASSAEPGSTTRKRATIILAAAPARCGSRSGSSTGSTSP